MESQPQTATVPESAPEKTIIINRSSGDSGWSSFFLRIFGYAAVVVLIFYFIRTGKHLEMQKVRIEEKLETTINLLCKIRQKSQDSIVLTELTRDYEFILDESIKELMMLEELESTSMVPEKARWLFQREQRLELLKRYRQKVQSEHPSNAGSINAWVDSLMVKKEESRYWNSTTKEFLHTPTTVK